MREKRCRTCGQEKAVDLFPSTQAKRCIACAPFCTVCGTPCIYPRKTCSAACTLAAQLEGGRKGGIRRGRQLRAYSRRRKTKQCPSCLRTKPKTLEFFTPHTRDRETGEILRFDAYCRLCKGAYQTDWRHTNPRAREDARRRERESRARLQARRAADPVFDAEWREHRSELQRARRERKRSEDQDKTPKLHDTGMCLPGQPFLDWIERQTVRHGMTEEAFCEAFGISVRRVTDIRRGAQVSVQLGTADSAIQAEGSESFWDVFGETLYPEEEAVAA